MNINDARGAYEGSWRVFQAAQVDWQNKKTVYEKALDDYIQATVKMNVAIAAYNTNRERYAKAKRKANQGET